MMRKWLTGLLLATLVSVSQAFQITTYVEQELPDKSNAANVSIDSITLRTGGIRFPDTSYQTTAASGGGAGGITWPSTFTLTTAYPFGVYATTLTATNTASFPAGYTASSGTVGGATFLPNGNTVLSGALNLPLAVNQCLQTNSLGNVTTSGGVCGGSGGGSGGSVAFTFNNVVVTSPTSNVIVDTNTMSYVAWPNGVSSGTLAVNQNLNISTLTLSGTGAAAFKMTEGAAAGVSNVASGLDVCWADSTNHALTCDFNNSGSSGTVALSSTTVTAGHCTNWTAAGLLGDSGAACGSGSGGGGGTALGVGTGTASGYTSVIVSSPTSVILFNNANAQFTSTLQGSATNLINLGANVPLLNANQTFSGTNTLTNSTLFTGSVTVSNVSSFTFTNVSSFVAVGSYFDFHQSSVTAGYQNGFLAGDNTRLFFVNGALTNLFAGYQAGSYGATGQDQTGVGVDALEFITSGQYNSCFGALSCLNLTVGSQNNVFGRDALGNSVNGASNTCMGDSCLLNATNAVGNTAIGATSLGNLTTGSSNTAIGDLSGFGISGSSFVTTGVGNTFVGFAAAPSTSSQLTSATAIGNGTVVGSSFTTVIGARNFSILSDSIPVVSTCGSNPSNVGSDTAGTITVGSGVTTACTLTFSTPWLATPTCVESDNSTTVTGDISSISTTAVTFGFSASLGSGQVYYICIGSK